tara:strand:- start:148 stop:444 length:297 start_codon:yes stop_codon:yes gene_type:complete
MRLLTTYDRIRAADIRCKEIVEELRELPVIEYCEEGQRLQTRGLNQEYLWSAQFIINQCQYIIDSDEWGYNSDFQWKMYKFQKDYKEKLDKINNYNEG